MLKNKKVVYFCQECGYESSKWMGQCPGCRAWNTFVEETVSTKKVSSTGSSLQNGLRRAEPVVLKDIRLSEDERKLTNIGELDRVLGGGIVPGSLVLVGRRSGNRKIYTAVAGLPESFGGQRKNTLYFGRGIVAAE